MSDRAAHRATTPGLVVPDIRQRLVHQRKPFGELRPAFELTLTRCRTDFDFVAVDTDWTLLDRAIDNGSIGADTADELGKVLSNTIPVIARLLVREFVLAFEIASILLLAAIIGALALVREEVHS